MYSWDIEGFGLVLPQTRTPRLTLRCEYPDLGLEPTQVTFRLSPSYGIYSASEAHEWFLRMMQEYEEFEVETDQPGKWPMPFCTETVTRVTLHEGSLVGRLTMPEEPEQRGLDRFGGPPKCEGAERPWVISEEEAVEALRTFLTECVARRPFRTRDKPHHRQDNASTLEGTFIPLLRLLSRPTLGQRPLVVPR